MGRLCTVSNGVWVLNATADTVCTSLGFGVKKLNADHRAILAAIGQKSRRVA